MVSNLRVSNPSSTRNLRRRWQLGLAQVTGVDFTGICVIKLEEYCVADDAMFQADNLKTHRLIKQKMNGLAAVYVIFLRHDSFWV